MGTVTANPFGGGAAKGKGAVVSSRWRFLRLSPLNTLTKPRNDGIVWADYFEILALMLATSSFETAEALLSKFCLIKVNTSDTCSSLKNWWAGITLS